MPIRAFYTFNGACFVHFPTSFVPVITKISMLPMVVLALMTVPFTLIC
jgi:hypothetical protein